MKDYIKDKIIERTKDRVTIMTQSMLIRNAWFKQTIDRAMESKNLSQKDIEEHFVEYQNLMFRYEAIILEIKKLFIDLSQFMENGEFETFRWSYIPRIENKYMVEILTKSDFDR